MSKDESAYCNNNGLPNINSSSRQGTEVIFWEFPNDKSQSIIIRVVLCLQEETATVTKIKTQNIFFVFISIVLLNESIYLLCLSRRFPGFFFRASNHFRFRLNTGR